ncbi:MAG: hypothetical protein COY47_08480 [Chloroflexi bacterium CG_4_10_14_0_8_um_filter_57_5]|nr:MAG: hypothetical protein COY47_08480 [Chloroflexi bacterium CG_4_10_14_0_8_um_filter_57_5]
MQRNNPSELRALWLSWADFLRRLGLENLAAWALEAAGPLTVLGAQALYLGAPLLRPAFSDAQVGALAHLLEDDEETRAFAAFLREEGKA